MKKYWLYLVVSLLVFAAAAQQPPLDSLNRELQVYRADSNRVKLLLQKSKLLENSYADSAKKYCAEALQLSRQLQNSLLEVTSLHRLGNIYLSLNRFDTARMMLMEGLTLAKSRNHTARISGLLNNIGITYNYQNNPGKAIEYYLESAQYLKNDTIRLAPVYSNISGIFMQMQQNEKALEYGEKAIQYSLATRDSMNMSSAYTNTANILRALKDTGRSNLYYAKALMYGRHVPDLARRMTVYLNMAIAYNQSGQREAAQQLTDSCLFYATKIGDKLGIAYALNLNGMIQYEQQQYAAARSFYYEAEKVALLTHHWGVLRETYSNLAMVEKVSGNYPLALAHLQKYADLKDSSMKEETAKTAGFLEARYRTEATQQQISQLQKEKVLQSVSLRQKNMINYLLVGALLILAILLVVSYLMYQQKQLLQKKVIRQLETDRQLTATNLILQGQEEERRRLARDLHDGLGGMLSGVKYAFQKAKTAFPLNEVASHSFDRSVEMLDRSIHELRRIAQDLGPESLLKYGISAAISDYCTNINKSEAINIVFQPLQTERIMLDASKSNIIFRIVQELINNILRHSEAKTAIVQLSHENNMLSVTVEDDGRGLDPEQLKNSKGMGWSNIRSRIDYLKGVLDIKSYRGKGTYVHFTVDI